MSRSKYLNYILPPSLTFKKFKCDPPVSSVPTFSKKNLNVLKICSFSLPLSRKNIIIIIKNVNKLLASQAETWESKCRGRCFPRRGFERTYQEHTRTQSVFIRPSLKWRH